MSAKTTSRKILPQEKRVDLIGVLKNRFEKNKNRHKGLEWTKIQAKLEMNIEKLW